MTEVRRAGRLPLATREDFAAEWARRKYVRYCQYVHHGAWEPGRHHQLICDKLDAVARGEITRLMIWMPPQHGKSMAVTETFPSYFLGRNPEKRVIEASYNDTFAQKFGRKNREKIEEFGSRLWNIGLSPVNHSASGWDLDRRAGGMISVGFGGAATGEGADLLIIDDPVKNRQEADSRAQRDHIWDEYASTFRTRVHPGAAIIVVMTRWHEDDLCGRLLNPDYGAVEDWDILRLPAVAEEQDLLGRAEGEALWPEHGYDREWLKRQKASIGSYAFAGLYQQRPAPAEGGIFRRDWFQFYDRLPETGHMIQSWDCTFKDNDNSDYVAGHVWLRSGPNYYLVDRVHDRMGISETMRAVRTLSAKHPQARAKLVEDKANGTAVIELLRKELPGLIPVNPMGGKVVRAQAVSPYAEAGNIFLPRPADAPWIHDFIEECASFPNAAHDDDVDAMTQALTWLEALAGDSGGLIYRQFAESPYRYIRKAGEIPRGGGTTLIIGAAIGDSTRETALCAAVVSTEEKQRGLYIAATAHLPLHLAPDQTARAAAGFVREAEKSTELRTAYIYFDAEDSASRNAMRRAMDAAAPTASVRRPIKANGEVARINITQQLISMGRFLIAESCGDLVTALQDARWSDSGRQDARAEDGTADTTLLRAMEYTAERAIKDVIGNGGQGQ